MTGGPQSSEELTAWLAKNLTIEMKVDGSYYGSRPTITASLFLTGIPGPISQSIITLPDIPAPDPHRVYD